MYFPRLPFPAFLLCVAALLPLRGLLTAQTVHVSVDVTQDRIPVSPYLYGKNHQIDSPDNRLTEADWQLLRDAGVRMVRSHGGNNGTKYNWQKKLTSHPDWYNNVYGNDWDFAQTSLQQHLPGVQSMWCFQLLGKVADNAGHNFDDWGYNRSQWWSGVAQNLAGGGTPNPAGGGKALKEGDISQYLTDTSAATSTAILDHWIKTSGGLGLDSSQFRYWNMDNEPEIWNGTHDDVMPVQLSAEAFMQRYFDYAKQARARFPGIRLVGPVTANEWQWYNWASTISADGRTYPWLEYFIKRVGEEQARTGVRLLDVLDIHYYPSVTSAASVVQLHRTFFDTTYVNPDANGVRAVNGGWDTSITQEYIFGRCQQWMDKYLGAGHGVTLGLTETGIAIDNAPVASVWYASTIGEFMKHGVEIFTPWSWQPGMWEVLHLYSRYNYTNSVRATSDDETNVSAYATTDDSTANVAVVLVNRALTASKSITVALPNVTIPNGNYTALQLANLPVKETFVSHTVNALTSASVSVSGNQFTITLPALSIVSVRLPVAVLPPDPVDNSSARLINISTRSFVGTGAAVQIAGFIITGPTPKTVLIRASGPALTPFGVTGVLANPQIELHDANNIIATNDDWSADATQAADIEAARKTSGAFVWPVGSKDSAIVRTLQPGGYTAIVSGVGNTTGVALIEVYEISAGASRLTNISTRSDVETGAGVQIAGFIIGGTAPKRVLIRASGPALTPFGVSGVLGNPQIELHDANTIIATNDDWSSSAAAIETARQQCGAFAWPSGSKDAAIVATLQPGGYTAIVSGVGNTTGVALIEVYELP